MRRTTRSRPVDPGSAAAGRGHPGPSEASRPELLLRRRALSPARRPALLALVLGIAFGLVGAYHYVWGFWLYRGFGPPQLPHSVPVALVTNGAATGRAAGTAGASVSDRLAAAADAAAALAQTERLVPVLPGTLETIELPSPVPRLEVPTIVYLPPGYFRHPTWRYPVLYLLHGEPGRPRQFVDVADVQTDEAMLVARGAMRPVVIVMPAGSTGFLDDTEWVDGVGPHSDWMTYFTKDVVGTIDRRFRVIPNGAGRGIGGNSEGGYAAINIALHHPAEFGFVESWSGYMTADGDPALFGNQSATIAANSPLAEVQQERAVVERDHVFFWFYCGKSDYDYGDNRAFATELTALGLPHRFFMPQGSHDWAQWRPLVPAALEAAASHLKAAGP